MTEKYLSVSVSDRASVSDGSLLLGSASPVSLSERLQTHGRPPWKRRGLLHPVASSTPSTATNSIGTVLSSVRAPDKSFKYAPAGPNSSPLVRFVQAAESNIENVIFDFRFSALLAIGGSLAGSVLCFLNGSVYIVDVYKVYWTSCVKGIHTGQMVLQLVEAIDVYLAGTVMLIFGMGLYGLFISNVSPDVPTSVDCALKGSSLFGMFALKESFELLKNCRVPQLNTKKKLLTYVQHITAHKRAINFLENSKNTNCITK
ncbi:hypothetical protein ACJRO7_017366 [Eucalyptus globulus]|uniref:CASP-like protein n=1 Tax=Eucalyptus globulus TaxID=34317 RepID=A0ABD3KQ52_EUCGL